jgi:hypothetical protein
VCDAAWLAKQLKQREEKSEDQVQLSLVKSQIVSATAA